MKPLLIKAPLLSVNDLEAKVVSLDVTQGSRVDAGQRLCTLESTKAAVEVESEAAGYVRALVRVGQNVAAGDVLFEISDEPLAAPAPAGDEPGAPEAASVLITDKARELAQKLGISLDRLPPGRLITEAAIREFIAAPAQSAGDGTPAPLPRTADDMAILGAEGHARSLIDLIRQAGQYRIVGVFADPLPAGKSVLGVPVRGGERELKSLHGEGLRLVAVGVGAIGRNQVRKQVFERIATEGFATPRLIHPRAVVEPSAKVASGAQIFALSFVGSAVEVGFGAIVNSGAIVSHDCVIGDFAHIAPGALLAGSVRVGAGALIGMGVTAAVGVEVGEWARIGNGARLLGNVPAGSIVHAGASWPSS